MIYYWLTILLVWNLLNELLSLVCILIEYFLWLKSIGFLLGLVPHVFLVLLFHTCLIWVSRKHFSSVVYQPPLLSVWLLFLFSMFSLLYTFLIPITLKFKWWVNFYVCVVFCRSYRVWEFWDMYRFWYVYGRKNFWDVYYINNNRILI